MRHEFLKDGRQLGLVVDDLERAVDVDGDIVPGRHGVLNLVPGRRDVGVRSGEHCQNGLAIDVAPLRIGPGHMAPQSSPI